jgi:O-antigen/teichoic acid export membrane protein
VLEQLKRLLRHSAVYGLAGIVQKLVALPLLYVYTRYLGRTTDATKAAFGALATITALSAFLAPLLRAGISTAFFRFYFDSDADAGRRLVIRTSFWFTMGAATAGLAIGTALSGPVSLLLFGTDGRRNLVIAGFVAMWAQMNYEQQTALFRVEERSRAFAIASVANLAITVGLTLLLVVGGRYGATGAVVGNFSGTLCVYVVLLVLRRETLGRGFDRDLLRRMNRFGLPLVPSALAVTAIDYADRFFLGQLGSQQEVGVYAVGVQISSVMVLLLFAFRTAWPAFAYSIADDDEARRTYGYVLTYLVLLASWLALALGGLAPWLVQLAPGGFHRAADVVAPLAFSSVFLAGYTVVAIGVGRAKRTQLNWVVTGAAALVNVVVNVALIPPYGQVGAAIATVAAYVVAFGGMAWRAQAVFAVPYQWRRLAVAVGAAVALTVASAALSPPLPVAALLVCAYPVALAALGFFLPEERRRTRLLVRRLVPGAR